MGDAVGAPLGDALGTPVGAVAVVGSAVAAVGAGVGYAQAGFVPVVEIPYAKYLDCGADVFFEACVNDFLGFPLTVSQFVSYVSLWAKLTNQDTLRGAVGGAACILAEK